MRLTEVGTPVATSDGKDGEFGDDDGGTDGGSDFFGGLDSETDVTLAVTDDHDGLESGSLTGTSLLLHGFDLYMSGQPRVLQLSTCSLSYLHDFILQFGQEKVDNLVLLDGERVQVDLFHALDLSSLDQTS